MKIDCTKVGNGLNFLEKFKLMKVLDKGRNFPGFKFDYASSTTSYWISNYFKCF